MENQPHIACITKKKAEKGRPHKMPEMVKNRALGGERSWDGKKQSFVLDMTHLVGDAAAVRKFLNSAHVKRSFYRNVANLFQGGGRRFYRYPPQQ